MVFKGYHLLINQKNYLRFPSHVGLKISHTIFLVDKLKKKQ